MVTLHLCRRQNPAALVAGVLPMLRTTLLGGKESCEFSPGVPVGPEGALAQQAVQPCLVRVARHLVAVQVVPTRELVMAEAAGEPGTGLAPQEPLLHARLARAPREGGDALLEGSRVPDGCHA